MAMDQRIKILELLAEGGALTVFGSEVDGEWRYSIEINEMTLEDEGGGISDRPARTWQDVLDVLEHYHWRKLGTFFVHPDYAERIQAARRAVPAPARARDVVRRAIRTFERAGLVAPPVPERFAGALRLIEPWCFATRDIDPMSMYMFDRTVSDGLAAADVVAFSHAGHGINSYAINYFLVDGPLALFAQVAWGGAYADSAESAAAVAQLFERCSALIRAMDDARMRDALPAGRLVVVESQFRDLQAWGWIDAPFADGDAAREWLQARPNAEGQATPATAAALEWLQSGAAQQRLLF